MGAPKLRNDLILRLIGAAALMIATACLVMLLHDPAALQGHADWRDIIAAAGGFLGFSGGAMLVLLGRHIHDLIAVSSPWAPARRDRRR